MKIGFYDHGLSYRGTTRAMLAYMEALYMQGQTELFHFFDASSKHNSRKMIRMVLDAGKSSLVPIATLDGHNNIFSDMDLDRIYYVTSVPPSRLPVWCFALKSKTRLLIHQVGYQESFDDSERMTHAYTSHWQNSYLSSGTSKVLPYIIPDAYLDTPSTSILRTQLGISNDAIVLGRHGGPDTFNLPFAQASIQKAIESRSDLHIIFAGTPAFMKHSHIHFLPVIEEQSKIIDFIDACDAMLHCRWEGETFGLACAEFLARGKPLITWSQSRERNHVLISDRACLFYHNEYTLTSLLHCLKKDELQSLGSLLDKNHIQQYRSSNIVKTLISLLNLA